jgi:hypothetical protein
MKNFRTPRSLSECSFDIGYPSVYESRQPRSFPSMTVCLSFLAGWTLAWWVLTL